MYVQRLLAIDTNKRQAIIKFSLQTKLSSAVRLLEDGFAIELRTESFNDDDIDCGAYDSSGLLRHAKAIGSIRLNILRAILYY